MGRENRQRTYNNLPDVLKERVIFVCPPIEEDKHLEQERNVIVENGPGIHNARQTAYEHCETSHILFIDDDMNFLVRKDDDTWKLRNCNEDDVLDLVNHILELFDSFDVVGLSQRAGNNFQFPKKYVTIGRMNNIYAFKKQTLLDAGARFDNLPLMEDFDVTLTLLKAGIPNVIIYRFAWGQYSSNMQGGCSWYRDNDLQKLAAYMLSGRHEPFVTVTERHSKSSWEGMEKRTDVRISWKEAFRRNVSREFMDHIQQMEDDLNDL